MHTSDVQLDNVYSPVPPKNQRDLLELALSAAEDEGFNLRQNNTDALKNLEAILDRLSKSLRKIKDQEYKDKILHGAAIEYAAYLVWFMENTTSIRGKWYYHHKIFGENTFPYLLGDTLLFPYSWVLKYIDNPKSEGICDKYSRFIG
jgi:hypothetical protein